MCVYIYVSDVWGLRPTGKLFPFVSFARARAAVCKVRMDLKNDTYPFSLFPFRPEISSLLPCEIRCSLSLAIDKIRGSK